MNEDYFDYLTKRLDAGVTGNLFVSKSTEVIEEALSNNNIVKVLDLGCFSGALLNNILSQFSLPKRNRIRAVGVDINISAMNRGAFVYKDIIFLQGNLESSLPIVNQYDVVLLSNILHELISKLCNNRITETRNVLMYICNFLKPGGKLIFLDGVKLEKNKKIQVKFHSNGLERFRRLANQYKAKHIVYVETEEFCKSNMIMS